METESENPWQYYLGFKRKENDIQNSSLMECCLGVTHFTVASRYYNITMRIVRNQEGGVSCLAYDLIFCTRLKLSLPTVLSLGSFVLTATNIFITERRYCSTHRLLIGGVIFIENYRPYPFHKNMEE